MENTKELNITYWTSDKVPLTVLKRWVEAAIADGGDYVSLELDYGRNGVIDDIKLIAEKH